MSNSGIDPFQRVGDITERYRVEIAEQLIDCRFMMETDYIDDPEMPGAVLGPKTVPGEPCS